MKLNKITNFCCFIVISLILHACGPQYQTHTNYTPPNTEYGLQCIRKCASVKNSCENSCMTQKNSCATLAEQKAQNDYNSYIQTQCYYINGSDTATVFDPNNNFNQHPKLSLQRSQGYSGKLQCRNGYVKTIDYFRDPYFCSNQNNNCLSMCTASYDGCYESCGGVVIKTTVCVSNCDKIK